MFLHGSGRVAELIHNASVAKTSFVDNVGIKCGGTLKIMKKCDTKPAKRLEDL